jgi:hypothetical protein
MATARDGPLSLLNRRPSDVILPGCWLKYMRGDLDMMLLGLLEDDVCLEGLPFVSSIVVDSFDRTNLIAGLYMLLPPGFSDRLSGLSSELDACESLHAPSNLAAIARTPEFLLPRSSASIRVGDTCLRIKSLHVLFVL